MIAHAQFKKVGPPPFSPAAAHQRIRTLLEKVDPDNRRQTVATISGWLVWYRDIFDEELIAAWQRDTRANLTQVIKPLVDARIASGIIDFSWRQQRAATFNLTYAPMLGDVMSRYPDSARPFLDDLLGRTGQQTPQLSQSEAEAVCRILIDMPDTSVWKKSAQLILPLYRRTAESLLDQDARGDDQEKAYRAQVWLGELRPEVAGITAQRGDSRRPAPSRSSSGAYRAPVGDETSSLTTPRRIHVDQSGDGSHAIVESDALQAPIPVAPAPVPLARPEPLVPTPAETIPSASLPYSGPRSGTLECRTGVEIPQNGEYVFTDLPPGRLQLDYDAKVWDSRLSPGAGNSQRLILTNKRPGMQKRCVVRWTIVP
jgi:hypothetical protein